MAEGAKRLLCISLGLMILAAGVLVYFLVRGVDKGTGGRVSKTAPSLETSTELAADEKGMFKMQKPTGLKEEEVRQRYRQFMAGKKPPATAHPIAASKVYRSNTKEELPKSVKDLIRRLEKEGAQEVLRSYQMRR